VTTLPPISYDIIGCGSVVQQYHLPVLRALEERSELTVAGCYDRDPQQARRVATMLGAERWGTDARPSETDGVEAALVATPPSSHAEIALQYIRLGKSVFVEKPFTRTAGEAEELLEASRAHRVTVAVNQFWRFYPSANIARRWLQPLRSEVTAVEATDGSRLGWVPTSDYVIEDAYGGVFHDMGAHLVDIALYLLGLDEVSESVAFRLDEVSKVPATEPSQESRARVTLRAPDRQRIEMGLAISRLRPLAQGIKIRGPFGVLFVPAEIAPTPILFQGEDAFKLRFAEPEDEPADLAGCFLLAHLDFLGAIRDPAADARLSAARFLLLSKILETLHGERP
jgi:predicted dehydrogenase